MVTYAAFHRGRLSSAREEDEEWEARRHVAVNAAQHARAQRQHHVHRGHADVAGEDHTHAVDLDGVVSGRAIVISRSAGQAEEVVVVLDGGDAALADSFNSCSMQTREECIPAPRSQRP